jgi:hypothetical protein
MKKQESVEISPANCDGDCSPLCPLFCYCIFETSDALRIDFEIGSYSRFFEEKE